MRPALLAVFMFTWFNLAAAQNFKLLNGDTINRVDVNNLKQGKWIILGSMKRLPGYGPDKKIEEGAYQDNRKQGVWTKYYPAGSKQNEIEFLNNRPNGPYIIYYENGQIEESGTWNNNRNTGTFERYYDNGNLQQKFNFASDGKRQGRQEYYHENGQLMIEGSWDGGKEKGEVKEYYANGELKSVKHFNDGLIDATKTESFADEGPTVSVTPSSKVTTVTPAPVVDKVIHTPNIGSFDGNGVHTLYNRDKQISQKGLFKNYRLIEGEWFRYDDNGILVSIEIYKNGKYVGEGVLPVDK